MKRTGFIFIFLISLTFTNISWGQAPVENPTEEVFKGNDIDKQLDYIFENSRTYVNNKVVKIDWLNRLKESIKNYQEMHKSVKAEKDGKINNLSSQISSLESKLEVEQNKVSDLQGQVDSFSFLGSEIGKGTFSTIFWSLTLLLTFLTTYFLYKFKRSISDTKEAKEELSSLQESYE